MHGSIWEWCEDVFNESFYSRPEAAGPDPVSTWGWKARVFRGGYWGHRAAYCRSADRFAYVPSFRDYAVGLRLSRPLQ